MSTITASDILGMASRVQRPMIGGFGGVRIIESEHATKDHRIATFFTDPRPSKNRSRRLWKKLRRKTARTEYFGDPAILKTPEGLVVHPTLYIALRNSTQSA